MNYIGKELEIFQHAKNWKNYYASLLKPFLKDNVLEVGAGIGSTTQILCDGNQKSWTCLEPDPELYDVLKKKLETNSALSNCKSVNGTLRNLYVGKKFNAILYIDVIEHIENDLEELNMAKAFLEDLGHLIILTPAHPTLFSAFDKAVGHHRRYNKKMLVQTVPPELQLISLKYLDSVGVLASLLNKWILRQAYPTTGQIKFWDRCLVPVSKIADRLTTYGAGKTLLGIWQKR